MPSRPTVSVLLPAFRAEACIARAVGSVMAQDFDDWEIVIASDDGADYLMVLAGAGLADARIRQVDTGGNGSGTPAARNVAFAAARGRLITPLDADDLYSAGRLTALVPLACRHGAAVDNITAVDEATGDVITHFLPPEDTSPFLTADKFFRTSVPTKPLVAAEIGLQWDPKAGISDDVIYLSQLLGILGPLKYLATPLQEYRIAKGSVTNRADTIEAAEQGYRRSLRRIGDGTLVIANPPVRAAAQAGLERKLRLNRAYGTACERGFTGSFQAFADLDRTPPLR